MCVYINIFIHIYQYVYMGCSSFAANALAKSFAKTTLFVKILTLHCTDKARHVLARAARTLRARPLESNYWIILYYMLWTISWTRLLCWNRSICLILFSSMFYDIYIYIYIIDRMIYTRGLIERPIYTNSCR